MRIRKGLVVELILIILAVSAAVVMYNVDLDLIFFKVYTTKSLEDKKIELEQKMNELETTRVSHKNALKSLENAKSSYADEKSKYEAISEDVITTINEATMGEEYNLEYIWISLGNYARQNNLKILLYEPGANVTTNNENNENDNTTEGDLVKNDGMGDRPTESMRVEVTGTYLNVCEFFYRLENDAELRFNLDNIRMEYLSNNNISAVFEVKGLSVKK